MKIRLIFETLSLFLLIWQINAQNIIKNGDFQSYNLDIRLSLAVGKYTWEYYTTSWYGGMSRQYPYQITNYLNQSMQGLDTIQGKYSEGTFTCQKILLHVEKAYSFAFDYVVDHSGSKPLRVTFNDELIYQQLVYQNPIAHFSTILRPAAQTGILCFIGFYSSNKYWALRGVIVDNVILEPLVKVQEIEFNCKEDWENKKLTLQSNFQADPSKLLVFDGTQILIGLEKSSLLSIQLGVQQNLIFVTDLDIELNQSSLEIQIIILDDVFVDNQGYSLRFVVTNNLTLTLKSIQEIQQGMNQQSNLFQQNNYIQQAGQNQKHSQNTDLPQMNYLSIFGIILSSMNALGVVGSASLIFKLLAFVNLYIMYIFLDVSYLNSSVRLDLETFADITLGKGLISYFSELIYQKPPNLTFFKMQTVQKIPKNIPFNGSAFQIINLSTNVFDCCFEDFLLIIMNCSKIFFVWFIFLKMNKLDSEQKRDLKYAILIEIVSVAPIWTLSFAVTLSPICQFSSQDFATKINQSIFALFPTLFIIMWMCIFLLYRSKKRVGQKNQKQFLFKQKKIKTQYIYSDLKRIQPFKDLLLIFFGFFIGFQNLYLFFFLTTCYQLFYIILLYKNFIISWSYLNHLIEALITSLIHFGFLSLFIITKITELSLVQIQSIYEFSNIISALIFYAFLTGIIFEALLCIINIVVLIVSFFQDCIKSLKNNSASKMKTKIIKNNKVSDISRKKRTMGLKSFNSLSQKSSKLSQNNQQVKSNEESGPKFYYLIKKAEVKNSCLKVVIETKKIEEEQSFQEVQIS